MYDTCYKKTGAGVYLWTAGHRFNHDGYEFVWQLYSAKTQYSHASLGKYIYSPMNYTYWYMRQPDNAGGIENCVNIWPNLHFQWNDQSCSSKFCFICEDRSL